MGVVNKNNEDSCVSVLVSEGGGVIVVQHHTSTSLFLIVVNREVLTPLLFQDNNRKSEIDLIYTNAIIM